MRFAQGKLREGSGSLDAEILRCAQDDNQDASQVRSREVLSPNVYPPRWALGIHQQYEAQEAHLAAQKP